MASGTSKGILWSAIDRFGVALLQFVINLILARLLTPDDLPYGLKYIWQLAPKQGITTSKIDKVYEWELSKICK